MKAGAIGVLSNPFTHVGLVAAVDEALARSDELVSMPRECAELRARFESLTPREREVFTNASRAQRELGTTKVVLPATGQRQILGHCYH